MVEPRSRRPTGTGSTMKTSTLKDEPHSILVAHGAEDTRIILKTALKEAGYHHISIAANGRQIFKRLERGDYDLLITAPDLPDINCWQFLRVIATGAFCSPRLPMLILCNAHQIPLIEPLAQEHHAYLLALDELAQLPNVVAACINGPPKPTILVVEDHPHTAQLIQLSLQTGFEVEIAPSGEEGLEAWRTRQHPLVLLDLMLPGLKGSEVLQQMIAEKPDQLVAIITARSEPDIHQDSMLSGAAAFLPKPVDFNELPHFCEGLLHDGACLSQCAQLEPQQESVRLMTERIQVVKFLLETGQTGRAAEYIQHALARWRTDPLRDDEWTRLLSELD